MDPKQIQDVLVVLGGLSGYAALAWTVYRDVSASREAAVRRLRIVPYGQFRGELHFRVEFDVGDATEALIARLEIVGSPQARLTSDTSARVIFDPMTDTTRPNPAFQGSRTLDVKLHRQRESPDTLSGNVAAINASSGISLNVTVSTWPADRRLMRRKIQVSAHA